jgi:hypothetical protein
MIGDDPACNQVRAYARLRDYATRRAAYRHCFAPNCPAIKDDLEPALHRSSILAEDNVHRTAATRPVAASCQVEIIPVLSESCASRANRSQCSGRFDHSCSLPGHGESDAIPGRWNPVALCTAAGGASY